MTDLTRISLENGLQVLLKEIHTAPLISSWIWYRVGSKDEPTGKTGISHWCEHMQFKGTPQFPASTLDKAISREGGTWNAFTFLDWTTYFETMPADKIDLALRLEADRMVNCSYDSREVESERTVIISEREGEENEPLFRLGEAIQAAAFKAHPYQHQVIGEKADLFTISRDDLYQHYQSYYHPGNAVLAIAGDFDTSLMLARIHELYDGIPPGSPPPRITQPNLAGDGEVRLTLEGPGETAYLQIGYHVPCASEPDFFPLSVLDSLLSGPSNLNMFGGGVSNKTSRLYRALVEKELAVAVHGGSSATIHPFLDLVTITYNPDKPSEQVFAAFEDEIKRLQDSLVSQDEVVKAIKQAKAIFAYGSENITNQAFWLGYAEMFDTYDWFLTYLEKLANVTPVDIQRVAQKYFVPQNRVIGTYLPNGEEDADEDYADE